MGTGPARNADVDKYSHSDEHAYRYTDRYANQHTYRYADTNCHLYAYRDLYRAPLGHQASTAAKACLWAGGLTLFGLFVYRHIGFSRTFVVALACFFPMLIHLL